MTYKKQFKKEDGTKYEIGLSIYNDSYSPMKVTFTLYKCLPGKRKFIEIAPLLGNDFEYRKLNNVEKEEYRMEKIMSEVKPEWISEVIDGYVNEIKTNIINVIKQ